MPLVARQKKKENRMPVGRRSGAAAAAPVTEFETRKDVGRVPGHASKRLGLNLSESVYEELSKLAKDRRSSMTEVVRLSLGLAKILISETKKGNKLIITTEQGDPLKEIVLP
jgi:hypothetical protein